jgi:hypothetical protein
VPTTSIAPYVQPSRAHRALPQRQATLWSLRDRMSQPDGATACLVGWAGAVKRESGRGRRTVRSWSEGDQVFVEATVLDATRRPADPGPLPLGPGRPTTRTARPRPVHGPPGARRSADETSVGSLTGPAMPTTSKRHGELAQTFRNGRPVNLSTVSPFTASGSNRPNHPLGGGAHRWSPCCPAVGDRWTSVHRRP